MWNNLHYTYKVTNTMKKKFINILVTTMLMVTYSLPSAHGEDIDLQLEIEPGGITIWSPAVLEFWDIAWASWNEPREITLTWSNFFYVEDLKSASSWYSVTLQMGDFFRTDNPNIKFRWQALSVKVGSWIELISWTATWVVVEPSIITTLTSLGTAKTILSRNVDIWWQVWKYKFYPTFLLIVPWWQSLWDYAWTLTYTLIE